ncbi:MAG: hypothetical protein H7832_03485 [Magnetococcus sp. DMHC-6]
MINAIPATALQGLSNPLVQQTSLNQVPHDIRTNNSEQLVNRNVNPIGNQTGSSGANQRSSGKETSAGQKDFPPQRSVYFESVVQDTQEKVSQTRQKVSQFFLHVASPATRAQQGGSDVNQMDGTSPSVDILA